MGNSSDENLRNLFSLYEFIGNHFAGSRLISDDKFKYIISEEFIWPNVLFGFESEELSEDIVKRAFSLYANSLHKPILVCTESGSSFGLFRKLGFMPIERWVGMEHSVFDFHLPEMPISVNFVLRDIVSDTEFELYAKVISDELFSGKSVSPGLFSAFSIEGHEVIGAYINEQLVATALVYYDEFGFAGIYMVCVSKQYQGKGFGKLIMAECFIRIDKKGIKNVVLQATKRGLALYEGLGFHKGINYNLYWKI